MNLEIGSKVTRKSYGNDIVFLIVKIEGDKAYLKGKDIRLYADANISDLELTDRSDNFEPDIEIELNNRDEYFYLPGKVLHLDGDVDYLNKSMKFYKKCGVLAQGKLIKEDNMSEQISKLLNDINPDILVITGHDAYYDKNSDSLDSYKNSKNFVNTVKKAREYEKSHDKLVIIAGACQSAYEELIKSGANFASSPKRINIHALDPAILAVNIALTDKNKEINIKELLSKTKYGKDGLGGIVGNGMMFIGYPR